MNKYLIKGMTLLAVCAGFASCSKDLTPMSQEEIDNLQALKVTNTYEQAFLNYVGGSIAEDLDWGFSDVYGTAKTRSQSSPACPGITKPYDEAWVTSYLNTATEPNSSNVSDNSGTLWYTTDGSILKKLMNNYDYCTNDGVSEEDKTWYTDNILSLIKYYWDKNVYNMPSGDDSEKAREALQKLTDHKGLEYWGVVSNWVTDFKITGTYSGGISVAGSEGSSSPGAERTIVVTGTWNITENQRIGSLGKIIIANGGTVNVASGKMLNMVNEARLVVLPGGNLTGAGAVEVNNGNAAGLENYNGGTVSVATFNNNFGKFYNYGDFLVTEYQGGAQESNFYNHHLAVIDHFGGTGSTANARIFNNCQFYVVNDARIRNYEGVNGSALIVGGQLMFSSSEDGTSTPTYVGLQQGALVKCATLYNNGTSWTGPTSGYAALEITDKIVYLNWQQDAPQTGGYFENNIYVKSATWDNVPDGNGYHQTDPSDAANYAVSIADYKFFSIVANCRGNNGVTKVTGNSTEIFSASEDFVLGQSGCTPGFTGDITTPTPPPSTEDEEDEPSTSPNIRIIAEDLNANGSDNSDFDFNDVVIDVYYGDAGQAKAKIVAAGGTLQLKVDGHEVHELFGEKNNANYTGMMINTNGTQSSSAGVRTRSVDNAKCPIITLSKAVNSAAEARDNIKIEVNKGSWIELEAKRGTPAAKVGVSPSYQFCNEREEINGRYPKFKEWVQSGNDMFWWQ